MTASVVSWHPKDGPAPPCPEGVYDEWHSRCAFRRAVLGVYPPLGARTERRNHPSPSAAPPSTTTVGVVQQQSASSDVHQWNPSSTTTITAAPSSDQGGGATAVLAVNSERWDSYWDDFWSKFSNAEVVVKELIAAEGAGGSASSASKSGGGGTAAPRSGTGPPPFRRVAVRWPASGGGGQQQRKLVDCLAALAVQCGAVESFRLHDGVAVGSANDGPNNNTTTHSTASSKPYAEVVVGFVLHAAAVGFKHFVALHTAPHFAELSVDPIVLTCVALPPLRPSSSAMGSDEAPAVLRLVVSDRSAARRLLGHGPARTADEHPPSTKLLLGAEYVEALFSIFSDDVKVAAFVSNPNEQPTASASKSHANDDSGGISGRTVAAAEEAAAGGGPVGGFDITFPDRDTMRAALGVVARPLWAVFGLVLFSPADGRIPL